MRPLRTHYLEKRGDDGRIVSTCKQVRTYKRDLSVGDVLGTEDPCGNCVRVLKKRAIRGSEEAKEALQSLLNVNCEDPVRALRSG